MTPAHHDYDLIVAGAGCVGVATALWAQSEGLRTLLCDPNPAGSGASAGSACTIATYGCIPVNHPSVFTALPRLLTSRDSPLSFNMRNGLKNPRWMASFLNNCRPSRVDHIARALARLLQHTDAGLDPLIALAGAQDLIVNNDCLYVYSTKAGYEAATAGNELRAALGVAFDDLTPGDIATLEPNLRQPFYRGLRFTDVRHISSPVELATRMHTAFVSLGGHSERFAINTTTPDADGVTAQLSDGRDIRGAHLAITAGARSGAIKGSGAEGLPLGTERGYHVLYRDHGHQISRPVGWAEAGFYATPMAAGLRIAGTVEINAIDAPFNTERTDYLTRKSHEMFDGLGAPDDVWLGHRPTLPDALPVIAPSPASRRIIMAFGHQHIGLTLAGVTGKIVTDIALGRPTICDLGAYAADRF